MRTFYIVLGFALSLMLNSLPVSAQAVVTLSEEELTQFKVVEVKLMKRELFACGDSLPIFDDNDFNQDGVLDDFCIGAQYDPCDIHTLQLAIIRTALSGGYGCDSIADREARGENVCDGFSPTPPQCEVTID